MILLFILAATAFGDTVSVGTVNPSFNNFIAVGDVTLGHAGSEAKIYRRFYGDGLINDNASPIDSPIYKLNFNATDYFAFYKYTYGNSISFRSSTGAMEFHGYNKDGNGGLGNYQSMFYLKVLDGINLIQFRNASDTSSLSVTGTGSSANFTIATENGNGNVVFSPHGTGQVSFTKPINFTAQTAEPADPVNDSAVMWMTDGTGAGDAGDIMMKVTSGSVTKTITLIDFSAAQ